MPELIDKRKTQNEIALIAKYLAKSDAQKAIIGRILFMIDHMPTIEPEVRHGRWIEMAYYPVGDRMYCDCRCSICNFTVTREKGQFPKFCENCGEKMKQEQPIAYNQAHTGAITAEQFEAIWDDKDDGGADNG